MLPSLSATFLVALRTRQFSHILRSDLSSPTDAVDDDLGKPAPAGRADVEVTGADGRRCARTSSGTTSYCATGGGDGVLDVADCMLALRDGDADNSFLLLATAAGAPEAPSAERGGNAAGALPLS
jgi:hypothetical protein